uniref:Uncharacterized protein n=1 Tax=Oryza sativa subsp. japonica TaxID=39947 RepID=Q6Z589_ORYSJ|nr:hypothetical protein [Oryza sativa Japonica Group]
MISHGGQNDYGSQWLISVTRSRRPLPEHSQNNRQLALPMANHLSSGHHLDKPLLHLTAPVISVTI